MSKRMGKYVFSLALLLFNPAMAAGGSGGLGSLVDGMNEAEEARLRIEAQRIELERRKLDLERAKAGEQAPWTPVNQEPLFTPRCRNETYIINGIAMKCRICGQTTTCDQSN